MACCKEIKHVDKRRAVLSQMIVFMSSTEIVHHIILDVDGFRRDMLLSREAPFIEESKKTST